VRHCACMTRRAPVAARSSAAPACRYTEYLASKFKSKNKAEFERQKNDDAFKRRFDPFVFKEEVEVRARTAQTTAVAVRTPHAWPACMGVLSRPHAATCATRQVEGPLCGRP
jgi:hypothetical protein